MKVHTWARYAAPPIPFDFFHLIASWNAGGSVLTACRGRWSANCVSEESSSPPHEDRCEVCERYRVERVQIEIGLDEMARNAP